MLRRDLTEQLRERRYSEWASRSFFTSLRTSASAASSSRCSPPPGEYCPNASEASSNQSSLDETLEQDGFHLMGSVERSVGTAQESVHQRKKVPHDSAHSFGTPATTPPLSTTRSAA